MARKTGVEQVATHSGRRRRQPAFSARTYEMSNDYKTCRCRPVVGCPRDRPCEADRGARPIAAAPSVADRRRLRSIANAVQLPRRADEKRRLSCQTNRSSPPTPTVGPSQCRCPNPVQARLEALYFPVVYRPLAVDDFKAFSPGDFSILAQTNIAFAS